MLCYFFSLTGFTCDSKHSFQCDNGQCVSKDLVCDSDNACADNSDEKKCKCYTTQFECPTGECLHVNQLCDSGNDGCHDKTDESRCGEQKLFLDGYVCQVFFLDVMKCYFSERSCSEDSFSCVGGGCLPLSFTCDGNRNCEDGTDEPAICGVYL